SHLPQESPYIPSAKRKNCSSFLLNTFVLSQPSSFIHSLIGCSNVIFPSIPERTSRNMSSLALSKSTYPPANRQPRFFPISSKILTPSSSNSLSLYRSFKRSG